MVWRSGRLRAWCCTNTWLLYVDFCRINWPRSVECNQTGLQVAPGRSHVPQQRDPIHGVACCGLKRLMPSAGAIFKKLTSYPVAWEKSWNSLALGARVGVRSLLHLLWWDQGLGGSSLSVRVGGRGWRS